LINFRIYTTNFWLICTSSLLFFASFNMLIPKLPGYLSQLGGGEYKGLIVSLFTVTALLSRPFSGRLADKIGRVPVMMFGSLVCLVCSLIYPLVATVGGFLLLRLVHGFSTGFTPTGQTAYLSDIIPANRRGEAMGLLGTAGSIGMAGGPAISDLLVANFGMNTLFYCSSFFAFASIVIVISIRETLNDKHRFHPRVLKVKKADLFEPLVIVPCMVMVLSAFAYGAMFTLIPDLSEHNGIKDSGWLFSCLTVASLMVRLIGGKASDRWGRRSVLQLSTGVIATAMLIIALADNKFMLIFGVILYGFAQGATSPTLLAWATDLSHDQFKARGIATLYMAMELGIGIGALTCGFIYGNDPANFFTAFVVCSLLAGFAFIYLFIQRPAIKVAS
jgi:MFS family permease